MNVRPIRAWPLSARPFREARGRHFTLGLAAGLLLGGLSGGCVRTTSLGRAGTPTDGGAGAEIPDARAPGDARDATSDDRGPTLDGPSDSVDATVDRGPIIGGGRDAGRDGDSADDATADGDGPDAI